MKMELPLSYPVLLDAPDVAVFAATGQQCEPYGETSFISLVNHHAAQALANQNAGLLVCNGLDSFTELRAATLGAWHTKLPFIPVVSVAQEDELPSGANLICALVAAQNLGICAFALSCPDEQNLREQLARLAPYAKVPLLVKVGNLLEAYPHSTALPPELSDVIVVCNETDVFYLNEDFELSEPVECELDMTDTLFAAANEGCDAISVHLRSNEDAYSFSLNAHMARLPVSFLAETEEALEAALIYYSGRAIVDCRSEVERGQLEALAAGYGAILR